ncbi:zinc finger BED domain-containing protein 5-like [Palaemon carinicauda]|uniref:zinc finger BED domain-containing protein 5-like n=1 Tax=Palaemon carinicauda TaxID=392227 RepID=UPI0035B57599
MDKFLIRKEASGSRESDSEQSLNPTNSNVKKAKIRHYLNRQYNESYLKFGFFWSGDAAQPNPLCVVCGDKMSNESMVPSKLRRHLTSKHSSLQDKDLVYFQRLLDQQSKQRNVFEKTMTASERSQLASIEVAEIIALKSKSHTLAESVILPACKKIVKSMFGEKAEKEISKIPLSNDTIHRRILDLSENIEKKVQKKLQDSTFALTVDESTDISNTSHLLAFVHFIDGSEIINQFLCCKGMSTTTRGQDIFDVLTDYLREMNLTWKSCVGICTDGAPCMTGCIKGFVSLAEKENSDLIRTHCFLHREVLISKISQEDLKLVLHQLVEIVNYIKSSPLKSRLFEQLCKGMDSQHVRLLMHTEVRWLSKGKVLTRVHELHKELIVFFDQEKQGKFCEHLRCELWMSKLEYLTEIFSLLNNTNSSMQGRNENILTSTDKLVALKKKIIIWKNRASSGNFDMFPSMRTTCIKERIPIVVSHLTALDENIDHYFPSLNTEKYDWIRNPFMNIPSNIGLQLCEEEELATISSDRDLKIKHSTVPIDSFWISVQEEYPTLSKKALSLLL